MEEAQYLTQVAMKWQLKLARHRFTHTKTNYCLQTVMYKKLMYPLVITAMTKTQCTGMLKPLLVAGFLATGFVYSFL